MNMRFYDLPASLAEDIEKLGQYVADFKAGKINPVQFKGFRVGYGLYEQREEGTFMMRVRCPGGAITPAQLKRVAEVSRDHGIHKFSITTRQEVQIQYLKLDDFVTVYKKLSEVGLSGRAGGGNCVRNITGSVDSGVRKDEAFDINPYLNALTTRMISESDSYDLPRKLKFTFSNHSSDDAKAMISCLGYLAEVRDGKNGFQVFVGGGTGSVAKKGHVLIDWIPAHRVYYVTKAIKQMFDNYGNRRQRNRAKIKWLYEKLGKKDFEGIFFRYYGLLQQNLGLELQVSEIANENQVKAGLAKQDAKDASGFAKWKERFVTDQKQAGLFQVRVPFLHGNIENVDALKLAEVLADFGENIMRFVGNQNLNLRNIPEAYLGNIYNLVSDISTLSDKPKVIGDMIACTGAHTCALGVTYSRPLAEELQKAMLNRGLPLDDYAGLKINISGCANGCSNNWLADIGIFGRADRKEHEIYPAYMIQTGGQTGAAGVAFAEKVSNIPAKFLPAMLADFFMDYEGKKQTVGSILEYIKTAAAKEKIHQMAMSYNEKVPTIEEDETFFRDIHDDQKFSILKGKKAECSAGLFDMIEVDFNAMEHLEKKLSEGLSDDEQGHIMLALASHTANSLLVTRGVECHEDAEVFENFKEHFIGAKLVPAEFTSVVELAKSGDANALVAKKAELLKLANHMRELYKSMDDSLRFNVGEEAGKTPEVSRLQEAAPIKPKPIKPAVKKEEDELFIAGLEFQKDFTGVGCPMNFVKTKIALAPMKSGQTLEIILDDGAPIANVPGSVRLEGHEVMAETQLADGRWSVSIKKK